MSKLRKKRQLKKALKISSNQDKCTTIGIFGTERGVGLTSTALLIVQFFAEIFWKKVAFLELGEHTVFGGSKLKGMPDKIMVFNRETKIGEIYNKGFDYLIIDFGDNVTRNMPEFLRCNNKLIVGSLQLWKQKSLYRFIDLVKETPGNSQYTFVISGSVEEIKKLETEKNINVIKMIDVSNSMKINSISIEFIEEILLTAGILNTNKIKK